MHNYSLLNINYSMFVPGLQYFDDDACAAMLAVNKSSENPYSEELDELESMTQPLDSNNINLAINEIKVYPNPINRNEYLSMAYNIACDAKIDCYIIDMIGKKLQEIDLQCGKRIITTPINEISSGVYTIIITQNGRQLFKDKFIVK